MINKQIKYKYLALALLMSLGTIAGTSKVIAGTVASTSRVIASCPPAVFSSNDLGEICAKINYYINKIDQEVLKTFQSKSCTLSYEKRVDHFGNIIALMDQEVFAPIKKKAKGSEASVDIALNKAAIEIYEGLSTFHATMKSYAGGTRHPTVYLKIALDFKRDLDGLKQRISKVIPLLQEIAKTVDTQNTKTKCELLAVMKALHKIVSIQGNPIQAINDIKYVYYECKG